MVAFTVIWELVNLLVGCSWAGIYLTYFKLGLGLGWVLFKAVVPKITGINLQGFVFIRLVILKRWTFVFSKKMHKIDQIKVGQDVAVAGNL